MAKVELKGFFENVGPIEVVGEKGTRVQNAYFLVPGYTDQFGDKVGIDEYWEISVMDKKIDELDLENKITDSRKAHIVFFVNSKIWYAKEDKKKENPNYRLYAVLSDVKHIA